MSSRHAEVRVLALCARCERINDVFANIHADQNSSAAFLKALEDQIVLLSGICGLDTEKKEELLDEEVENLIAERQAARKAKNFARADEIRNELLLKGSVLEDTREGVRWKRS